MSANAKALADMTAAEWADHLCARHSAFFDRHADRALPPTCIAQLEDGRAVALPCPWASEFERLLVLTLLRGQLRMMRAVRYAIFSEVWMTDGPAGPDRLAPRLDPQRQEAVLTAVVGRGQAPVTRCQRIRRTEGGAVSALELEDEFPGLLGGDLLTLLGTRPVH